MLFLSLIPIEVVLSMVALVFLAFLRLYRSTHFTFFLREKSTTIATILIIVVTLITIIVTAVAWENGISIIDDIPKYVIFYTTSMISFVSAFLVLGPVIRGNEVQIKHQFRTLFLVFLFTAIIFEIVSFVTFLYIK